MAGAEPGCVTPGHTWPHVFSTEGGCRSPQPSLLPSHSCGRTDGGHTLDCETTVRTWYGTVPTDPGPESSSATCAACGWTASGPWSAQAGHAHWQETGHTWTLYVPEEAVRLLREAAASRPLEVHAYSGPFGVIGGRCHECGGAPGGAVHDVRRLERPDPFPRHDYVSTTGHRCQFSAPGGYVCCEELEHAVHAPEPIHLEAACELMHDAYERAAAGAGWETQAASRKPWADVPEPNRVTMRAAVGALLEHLRVNGMEAAASLELDELTRRRLAALEQAAEHARETHRGVVTELGVQVTGLTAARDEAYLRGREEGRARSRELEDRLAEQAGRIGELSRENATLRGLRSTVAELREQLRQQELDLADREGMHDYVPGEVLSDGTTRCRANVNPTHQRGHTGPTFDMVMYCGEVITAPVHAKATSWRELYDNLGRIAGEENRRLRRELEQLHEWASGMTALGDRVIAQLHRLGPAPLWGPYPLHAYVPLEPEDGSDDGTCQFVWRPAGELRRVYLCGEPVGDAVHQDPELRPPDPATAPRPE